MTAPTLVYRSTRRWLPGVVLVAGVIVFFLSAKFFLFRHLEYTSDLFSHLQMSRGMFRGHGFLADNHFGSHLGLHNYFLLPLLYPLTGPFGAYGLFLTSALLTLLAVATILRQAAEAEPWQRERYWLVLVAGLLGPVAFWLLDDPLYGWHVELLYLPLAVLFATALSSRSRAAWLWAILLVLIREDGAIVAWAVHALHQGLAATDSGARRRWKRLVVISAGWAAVFAAGMLVLIANGAASGRLGTLTGGIKSAFLDTDVQSMLLASFGDAALLFCAGGLVLLAGIPWRGIALAVPAAALVAAPHAIGSTLYGAGVSLRAHGLAWPPRFAAVWSILIVAQLFCLSRPSTEDPPIAWLRRLLIVFAGIASFAAQAEVLRARRDYHALARVTAGLRGDHSVVSSKLSPDEDRLLRCLGMGLPKNSGVATEGMLFGRFHQQDVIWPDRAAQAWGAPVLVVCDAKERLPFRYGCRDFERTLSKEYTGFKFAELSLDHLASVGAVVSACRADASNARGMAEGTQRP